VILLFLILAGFPPVTNLLVNWAAPWLLDGIAGFSVMSHFESIQKGVLDSRDLIYFLSLIGFSLFTTSVILRAHRAG
jgi:ABC-2 type transport system permease protein